MITKQRKLELIQEYPEFLLEIMTFGAEHLLLELNRSNYIKPGKDGKKPNRATCHPFILQQFRRNIELSLEVSNG